LRNLEEVETVQQLQQEELKQGVQVQTEVVKQWQKWRSQQAGGRKQQLELAKEEAEQQQQQQAEGIRAEEPWGKREVEGQ
jgi:uncharacterized protein YjaG (DUF416 family)